jgi:hypothetical protein
VSFSADEFIRVIKACKAACVTELKIGDMEVKFGNGDTPKRKAKGSETPVVTERELENAQIEVNEAENLVEAEDRLDLLQIEDPSFVRTARTRKGVRRSWKTNRNRRALMN